jgi:hypothetical protein
MSIRHRYGARLLVACLLASSAQDELGEFPACWSLMIGTVEVA